MEITKKVAETSFRVSGFDLPNFVQKCLVFIFDQVASIVTKWINIVGSFFMLPLLIVKGPCMAHWTYQTEIKNIKEAQLNLIRLEIELRQYKPSEKELSTHNQPLPPFNTAADEMSA